MTDIEPNYDVIIVGGGPAGMSAAMWCSELRLSAVIIEKGAEFGGQLHWIHNPIENYIGIAAKDGQELLGRFELSLAGRQFERVFNAAVSIDLLAKIVDLADGRKLTSRVIILATGVRRRKLGVPGEDEFRGRGILESGARERKSVSGKSVVVVGGGDAAAENALILSQYADRVFLVHRRSTLSARPEFLDRVLAQPKIEVITDSVVEAIRGSEFVESVDVKNLNIGQTAVLAANWLLVRAGVQPNTEIVRGQLELDDRGYIVVDRECRTNTDRTYAIGDVANPKSPTIVSAAGMGATAAKSAFALLKSLESA